MTFKDREAKDIISRFKIAFLKSLIDAFIVGEGGIVFFSSMVALGYQDLLPNLIVAFISFSLQDYHFLPN